jgi:chemotaxis protein methyltransferase CheR
MGPLTADPDEPGREFAFSTRDFQTIVQRVRERTGIVLGESKRDLVYGRLGRRLRALGCTSFNQYLGLLAGPDAENEQAAMVNAITTNLTGFFREPHHFETLAKQTLPELIKSRRDRRLRIWSAGCSSGEEPYTIAMILLRALPSGTNWDALILATDIDTNMIATGRAGLYETAKVAPVPADLRRRYVDPVDDDMVAMAPALKQVIRFRPLNLLAQPWPMRGKFDVIFCRNVVIYFDKDTQRALFDRYADLLNPEGWLFIGHSESLFRVSDRFRHLGRTTYRKVR